MIASSLRRFSHIPKAFPKNVSFSTSPPTSPPISPPTPPPTPIIGNDDPSPCMTLYNSLSKTYQPLSPTNRKALAWYTCGPTVYDSAHLGHARTYILIDILHRLILHTTDSSSHVPLFVMNITDVDDKILQRAAESGVPSLDLARKFEGEFWEDMKSLNVMRPTIVTRVSEYVDSDVVGYVERIVEAGLGYVVPGEGVYFDVKRFESGGRNKYGTLGTVPEDFFGWDNTESKKRDPRDFALWKLRKPKEDLYWKSPWGEGRPGWHIECSAMIDSVMERFESSHEFCVHAGGVDLKFPHHVNEIAQAEAVRGGTGNKEWIPHWVHTGHLHIHGAKMSKSLKNFITIRSLLSLPGESPADDFRLWCLGLSGSYRGPATFSNQRLEEARTIRENIVQFLMDGEEWMRLNTKEYGTLKWGEREKDLYDTTQTCILNCHLSLTGDAQHESNQKGFDLDGSTCVKNLTQLTNVGSLYLRSSSIPNPPSVEALRFTLSSIRDLLRLLGFSKTTYQAGTVSRIQDPHGESKLPQAVDRLVEFRQQVRERALRESSQDILKLCDTVRDDMGEVGLEINDSGEDDHPSKKWRFCVPKTNARVGTRHGSISTPTPKRGPVFNNVKIEDWFRVGIYEDKFLDFDKDGMPLTNADGTPLSKAAKKKLSKKREKQNKKLKEPDRSD